MEITILRRQGHSLREIAVEAGVAVNTLRKRLAEGGSGAIGYVCIDVANGYTEAFVRLVEKFRQAHPQLTIFSDPPHIQV